MEHIKQLNALDTPCINAPEQLFLLLQTGDETLDYKQAAKLYQACPSWLEGAGNHSFEGFIERLPMILAWAKCEARSEEHTSELQSRPHLVCRLLLEKTTRSR